MVAPASRRGFLRGLTTLPFLGGGVALIGVPTAVAEPVTDTLMREYADWLIYEHHEVMDELTGGQSRDASHQWHALFGRSFDWHRARGPIRKCSSGASLGDGVSFPSTRAALVLSTVGCDWRGVLA